MIRITLIIFIFQLVELSNGPEHVPPTIQPTKLRVPSNGQSATAATKGQSAYWTRWYWLSDVFAQFTIRFEIYVYKSPKSEHKQEDINTKQSLEQL